MMNSRIAARTLVVITPLFLGGCMMLGSGGMMHGSQEVAKATPMIGSTLVKDTVVDGLRLTAEFPPYAVGDDLAYRVTLRRGRDSTAVTDLPVVMVIGRDDMRDHTSRVSPEAQGNGVFVFRPIITSDGTYRVVIRVERPGGIASAPGVELTHVVRLVARADMGAQMPEGSADSRWGPTALVGAGVMVLMMLLVMR